MLGENESASAARKRKRRSRWAPEDDKVNAAPAAIPSLPPTNVPPPGYRGLPAPPQGVAAQGSAPMLSRVNRTEPGLVRYALQSFGTTNLSEEDWKKAEDHYKVECCWNSIDVELFHYHKSL